MVSVCSNKDGDEMNERIKKIWDDAALEAGDESNTWEGQVAFMALFAELIVQECVQTLIDNTPVPDEDVSIEDWDKGYDQAMRDCVHHIQEHFGVEE